jgi:hypothetical protein
MINQTRIAIALAIVLGTASVAVAATKHPVSQHRHAVAHVSKRAYESFGSAAAAPADTNWSAKLGYDPYDSTTVRCLGGTCAPNWGAESGND